MDAYSLSRKDFPFNVLLQWLSPGYWMERMNDYWSRQDVFSYSNWFGELKDVQWTNLNASFKPHAENYLQQTGKILNKSNMIIFGYLICNT